MALGTWRIFSFLFSFILFKKFVPTPTTTICFVICFFPFWNKVSLFSQGGLELWVQAILLPEPPKCWNYCCVTPHLTSYETMCLFFCYKIHVWLCYKRHFWGSRGNSNMCLILNYFWELLIFLSYCGYGRKQLYSQELHAESYSTMSAAYF